MSSAILISLPRFCSRLTGCINDACAHVCRRGTMPSLNAVRADFDVAVGRRRLPTRPRVTRSARVNTCTPGRHAAKPPGMSFAYIPVRRRTITGVTDVRRGCSLETTACCTRLGRGKGRERGGKTERAWKRDGDNRDLSKARQREEKERGRGGR